VAEFRADPPVSGRRAGLLTVPALLATVPVLLLGLGTAAVQSVGLLGWPNSPEASADAYQVLRTSAFTDGLVVTVGVAAASTLLAVGIGFAAAVTVMRSRWGGRLTAAVATATIPVPHLVGAAAVGLLLADSGLVARLTRVEPNAFPPLVAGSWWTAVVLEYAWKESAFVAVVVLGSLVATERELDEAAAVLGAGAVTRLRRITLPLAAPALVATGSIAFAYVVGSYEVAQLLGRTYPEPLPVLAYRLFSDVDLAMRPQAMAVALATVAVASAGLAVGVVLLRRVAVLR
jgi:putative spermidine/putrescine transport system permease protein